MPLVERLRRRQVGGGLRETPARQMQRRPRIQNRRPPVVLRQRARPAECRQLLVCAIEIVALDQGVHVHGRVHREDGDHAGPPGGLNSGASIDLGRRHVTTQPLDVRPEPGGAHELAHGAGFPCSGGHRLHPLRAKVQLLASRKHQNGLLGNRRITLLEEKAAVGQRAPSQLAGVRGGLAKE